MIHKQRLRKKRRAKRVRFYRWALPRMLKNLETLKPLAAKLSDVLAASAKAAATVADAFRDFHPMSAPDVIIVDEIGEMPS